MSIILLKAIVVMKSKMFLSMLAKGEVKNIFNTVKHRTYSNVYYYFIRKDLELLNKEAIPEAKINITLRPYKDSDQVHFKNLPLDDMLLKANIPTCYVAVTDDDIPCYRQWFMQPCDNDKIQAFFKYNFPILKEDDCIFERSHAIKKFRGLNLMPKVHYLMQKKALDLGYKWVVGCIPIENSLSLRGVLKSNGKPYKLQATKRRFFIRRTLYIDIPQKLKDQNPWLFPKEDS